MSGVLQGTVEEIAQAVWLSNRLDLYLRLLTMQHAIASEIAARVEQLHYENEKGLLLKVRSR